MVVRRVHWVAENPQAKSSMSKAKMPRVANVRVFPGCLVARTVAVLTIDRLAADNSQVSFQSFSSKAASEHISTQETKNWSILPVDFGLQSQIQTYFGSAQSMPSSLDRILEPCAVLRPSGTCKRTHQGSRKDGHIEATFRARETTTVFFYVMSFSMLGLALSISGRAGV